MDFWDDGHAYISEFDLGKRLKRSESLKLKLLVVCLNDSVAHEVDSVVATFNDHLLVVLVGIMLVLSKNLGAVG